MDNNRVHLLNIVSRFASTTAPLTLESRLDAIGIDSITLLSLLIELEERFQIDAVSVAANNSEEICTIKDLLDILIEK